MKDLLQLSASKLQKVISIKRKIERLEGQLNKLVGGSGDTVSASSADAPRKRRKMSPEARQRISDAAKERWAKFRAGKK